MAGAGAVSAGMAWLRGRPGLAARPPTLDVMLLGVILLVAVVVGSVAARRVVAIERGSDDSRWLPVVGQAIDADSDGPCAAVTSVPPIIGWYSRCAAVQMTRGGAEALATGAFVDPTAVPVNGTPPEVEVYRFIH